MSMTREDEALPPVQICEHCGRPIRWVVTAASGTPYKIDAFPDPHGNQAWMPRQRAVAQLGPKSAKRHRDNGMPLYLWHGVNCAPTRAMSATAPKRTEKREPPASEETRVTARETLRRMLSTRRRTRWARRPR